MSWKKVFCAEMFGCILASGFLSRLCQYTLCILSETEHSNLNLCIVFVLCQLLF